MCSFKKSTCCAVLLAGAIFGDFLGVEALLSCGADSDQQAVTKFMQDISSQPYLGLTNSDKRPVARFDDGVLKPSMYYMAHDGVPLSEPQKQKFTVSGDQQELYKEFKTQSFLQSGATLEREFTGVWAWEGDRQQIMTLPLTVKISRQHVPGQEERMYISKDNQKMRITFRINTSDLYFGPFFPTATVHYPVQFPFDAQVPSPKKRRLLLHLMHTIPGTRLVLPEQVASQFKGTADTSRVVGHSNMSWRHNNGACIWPDVKAFLESKEYDSYIGKELLGY